MISTKLLSIIIILVIILTVFLFVISAILEKKIDNFKKILDSTTNNSLIEKTKNKIKKYNIIDNIIIINAHIIPIICFIAYVIIIEMPFKISEKEISKEFFCEIEDMYLDENEKYITLVTKTNDGIKKTIQLPKSKINLENLNINAKKCYKIKKEVIKTTNIIYDKSIKTFYEFTN